jgi:hypothetical protein
MEKEYFKEERNMITSNIVKLLNEMVMEDSIAKRKELFDKIIDDSMEERSSKKDLEIPVFMRKGA